MGGISLNDVTFDENANCMDAGEYVIIDPCYVIGEDPFWSQLCDFSFPEGDLRNTFFVLVDNMKIFIFSTAYGDGSYPVRDENGVFGYAGVDSGTLSMIPADFLRKNNLWDEAVNFGVHVILNRPAYPDFDNGNLSCDNINVLTREDDLDIDSDV